MANEFQRGQRASVKGRPWGMKPGTKGRISKVFAPGKGMGYSAEFRARGWHPMRVNKNDVDIHETATKIVDALLVGECRSRRIKTKPKAYMVGDPGTIGMSAGGD